MKLLTVKEVSEMVRAKPSTVYAWAEQGVLPCYRLGGLLRFSEADMLDWMEGCRKTPEGSMYPATGRRPRRGG